MAGRDLMPAYTIHIALFAVAWFAVGIVFSLPYRKYREHPIAAKKK